MAAIWDEDGSPGQVFSETPARTTDNNSDSEAGHRETTALQSDKVAVLALNLRGLGGSEHTCAFASETGFGRTWEPRSPDVGIRRDLESSCLSLVDLSMPQAGDSQGAVLGTVSSNSACLESGQRPRCVPAQKTQVTGCTACAGQPIGPLLQENWERTIIAIQYSPVTNCFIS